MTDIDTFLTTLYVKVDDFCKTHLLPTVKPGPSASLDRSEVITLAIVGQWSHFTSGRDFYQYAAKHFRSAFPHLPDRAQLNRQMRLHKDDCTAFLLHLVDLLHAQNCAYEILDTTGVRTRNSHRAGVGWFAGQANIGWCSRLGWYEGFHLLLAVNPTGAITGYGFAAASAKDQPMTETFLALRADPNVQLASPGALAQGFYIADSGFAGVPNHQRWADLYHARLICVAQQKLHDPGWQAFRRWLAGMRQIIESVNDKLLNAFRLDKERPHTMSGLQVCLAAKAALHNFCMWLNQTNGRPLLAFADLVDW